jgi:two-component system, LytTR family, sensor kinase
MSNKIISSIDRSRKRFHLAIVALVIFAASFMLFLFNYVRGFILGKPFNWAAWWEYFPSFFISNIATILFSYFILNHFYYLFNQRKRFTYFLFPLVFCITATEIYNIAIDYFFPLKSNINNPLPLVRQIVSNLLIGVIYIVFVLLIAYITHLRDERKKNRQLQEQKLKLEVEKAQAELKFVKSQINPHFLHNTLNSFYARSLPLSKDLADGILTLSSMMRYAIGETYTEDGKVLLKDEIEHLNNLIKIHQFRFRNHLNVSLEVKGELNGAVIIPFVLITLVENIFKHGDLADAAHSIKINIEVDNGAMRFYSCNKKKAGPKELSTGIGLDNIKKRLNMTYGNGYNLVIKDEQDTYSTELIIYSL